MGLKCLGEQLLANLSFSPSEEVKNTNFFLLIFEDSNSKYVNKQMKY